MARFFTAAIFFIGAFLSSTAISQTITLGSGTATNAYNEASPVNVTNRRNVSQFIYTVAELNAAGISSAATINQLGFFITNIPVLSMAGYTINMKHTNASDAAGAVGNTGYTTVKNAFTYAPAQGDWDMLDLDTPFNWNGTQNIAVRICWDTQPSGNPSGQLRIYPATNGFRYRTSTAGGASYCSQTPSTNRQWKPQIRFVFESETVWTGAANTNWSNSGNWTANVPDATMDARIPVGTVNLCNLTGTGNCKNLILEGELILANSGTLNIYGDMLNTGSFTDNGGATVLAGQGPNTINNSSPLAISNLRVESKFGGVITGSEVTITQELQMNKSLLNTNNLLRLNSDASGTARIAEITTNCFYELNMFDAWGDGWNGGTLTVLENGVAIGVYQAYYSSTTEIIPVANGALLQLQYASGIFENENSYNFNDPSGNLLHAAGPNPTTGIVFTTTATCGFTPPITGEIAMERYIDAGETYWRYFTSAVQGATVGQYMDDFVTAGFPGSPFPTFPFNSIYTYNESLGPGLGYVPCSGSTQVMQPGQGFQVWCGDTITGTQPFTLDLVGQPNQGPITMPVSYNNFGVPGEDGWNLVGNPYASTIDWDSPNWTKVNMSNAIYIQDPDTKQYATYVAGASTNGGSRYIASQQSFWVYANAASPQLIAREGVKSSVDQAFIKSNQVLSPGMTLRLQSLNYFDEAVVRHVDGSLESFEHEYDGKELWGGWYDYPQLSVVNTNLEDLSVHSFDLNNQEWVVPVRAIVFETGTYHLVFENISELDVPCLKLEDTYTGQMYDVYEGTALPFVLSDTTWSPRFLLHIGKSYPTQSSATTCYGYSNGEFQIDLGDPSLVNYNLSANGSTINGASAGDPLIIQNLNSEIYSLEIPTLTNICGQNIFNFVINQPNQLTTSAAIEDELFGQDGSLDITVSGGTQPYTFVWDSGQITQQLSGLSAGTYLLTVSDFNGCLWQGSFIVGTSLSSGNSKDDLKLIYFPDFNKIQIYNYTSEQNEKLNLVNMAGQQIQQYLLSPELGQYEFYLPSNLATGVYILGTANKSIQFKFVVD